MQSGKKSGEASAVDIHASERGAERCCGRGGRNSIHRRDISNAKTPPSYVKAESRKRDFIFDRFLFPQSDPARPKWIYRPMSIGSGEKVQSGPRRGRWEEFAAAIQSIIEADLPLQTQVQVPPTAAGLSSRNHASEHASPSRLHNTTGRSDAS